ncbi:uncharacterized protein EV422DRAFT_572490 [Fimicolochytrium jonesii]|uniref:uncharacterized protein n=1 Tax=Fimicolochytrium jonesii TaxID=1396493 RepID=UPI0022FF0632|nr:uncharacterized protein EV422DRAFT_572490 [Fimicolochytrium jonesii]KAI8815790.1 hypothetical protein EV422DRAFT_572490 [Fimicolochytrium jonesii]
MKRPTFLPAAQLRSMDSADLIEDLAGGRGSGEIVCPERTSELTSRHIGSGSVGEYSSTSELAADYKGGKRPIPTHGHLPLKVNEDIVVGEKRRPNRPSNISQNSINNPDPFVMGKKGFRSDTKPRDQHEAVEVVSSNARAKSAKETAARPPRYRKPEMAMAKDREKYRVDELHIPDWSGGVDVPAEPGSAHHGTDVDSANLGLKSKAGAETRQPTKLVNGVPREEPQDPKRRAPRPNIDDIQTKTTAVFQNRHDGRKKACPPERPVISCNHASQESLRSPASDGSLNDELQVLTLDRIKPTEGRPKKGPSADSNPPLQLVAIPDAIPLGNIDNLIMPDQDRPLLPSRGKAQSTRPKTTRTTSEKTTAARATSVPKAPRKAKIVHAGGVAENDAPERRRTRAACRAEGIKPVVKISWGGPTVTSFESIE